MKNKGNTTKNKTAKIMRKTYAAKEAFIRILDSRKMVPPSRRGQYIREEDGNFSIGDGRTLRIQAKPYIAFYA